MSHASLTAKSAACAVIVLAIACSSQKTPVGSPVQAAWEKPQNTEANTKPPMAQTPPRQAATPQAAPQAAPQATPQPAPQATPKATAQPATEQIATPPETGEAIATVNGSPISRTQFVDMLLESHGLNLLEQLILLTAARQRATELSLAISNADITAAHDDALRRIANPLDMTDAQPFDRTTAERLLQEFLTAKNLSQRQWDCRMAQRAYVNKIARFEVEKMTITEVMLRQEYDLAYGERIQIRHIQLSSLAAVRRARAMLAENKDFELLARQMSDNQITSADGGIMAPFPRNDTAIPPLIREAAFNLQPGEVSSPIYEGSAYHLIRLERKYPASDVGFANVDQDSLKRRLIDRLVLQRQESLENELFRAAKVEILNDNLSQQFNKKHR